ncbi:Pre-mRNA-splicing factor syf2 [Taphrina deformans PYCC 5710]|uniref:Pre-mRNA-splicing factor SYF2 n=1 Tax=Taphrina deformans (strain PYCC 5710 / ATCC 11124 / CBS 356.35 / IMI 108563 / JCM 9778 / NBRC 8474) TaxID=1097556 RepID=R4XAP7_TAPDE|nr:Pre-mRNA-splicing factor syf2 [Taphrina deformans PYCC 5710]|eukprot:CCG81388.1 Pre-mRNA-splicing factor syf2 [Taphrina deformans PYCC 5710]
MSASLATKRKAESQDVVLEGGENEPTNDTAGMSAKERMAQFRALKMRAKDSKKQNRTALHQEHSRMKEDPKAAKILDQKKSVATEKLAKLDAQEAGEDYERKRAWDWSIAESEAWDERMAMKQRHREESGFADFAQEAAKQYSRNTNSLKPDLEAYRREKEAQSSRTLSSAVTISADGTLVPNLTQVAEVDDVAFIHQKPKKENVDRLIESLSRADKARLKAQMKRGRGQHDDGDYISERNKVFNAKVSRFYDKYTKEMKESFERGTAQ